jgi:hypothetical protein
MENILFQGDIAETPLPKILIRIWQEERSGFLRITRDGEKKNFSFEKGRLIAERRTFDVIAFRNYLQTLGLVPVDDGQENHGFPRDLIQEGIFSASRLWELLDSYLAAEIMAVFDWPSAAYVFEASPPKPGSSWLRISSMSGLVLEGIRRMSRPDNLESHLPAPGDGFQTCGPSLNGRPELSPHERYLLDAAAAAENFGELLRTSELGEMETKRGVFALLTAGLLGICRPAEKPIKSSIDFGSCDIERVFNSFNDRCSFIYKYISKEIGPVALNVIEKSLDEIRGRIDPAFQNCVVTPDGRIELRALIRKNLGASGENARKSLLRSFDEILAAEVLAAKLTLGNNHEAALVRGLERIGEVH